MDRLLDRLFKTLARDDPGTLLRVFAGVEAGVQVTMAEVNTEVVLPAFAVDNVYEAQVGDVKCYHHFEAQSWWRNDVPERLAWYMTALGMKYKLPVHTTLVMMDERHAPRIIPESDTISLGGLSIAVEFRVTKLWETDPEPLLESGNTVALPWVTLMKSSRSQVIQAARRIENLDDERRSRAAAEFVLLGKLRYDEDVLRSILGRVRSVILEDVLKATGEWDRMFGKGIEDARIESTRQMLIEYCSSRFPDLRISEELNRISDLDVLRALARTLFAAPDATAARAAVLDAATAMNAEG